MKRLGNLALPVLGYVAGMFLTAMLLKNGRENVVWYIIGGLVAILVLLILSMILWPPRRDGSRDGKMRW